MHLCVFALRALSLIVLALSSSVAQSQYTAADITDLILITGQSNVTASQTEFDSSLDASHPQVFAFTSTGNWDVADLHQAWDVDGWHPGNGSLADSSRNPYNHFGLHFAKTIVENDPARVVGIIIAGAPGEGIMHWDSGSAFSQIINPKVTSAINAQGVKSTLDGILWHQGETDWHFTGTSDTDAVAFASYSTYYPEKLQSLIQSFREESWFAEQKPFICGETKRAPVNGRLMALNDDGDAWTGCVPARDLCTREGPPSLCSTRPVLGTHFDASGLRTLGKRYGLKYLDLVASVPTCNGLPVTVDLNLGQSPTTGDDVVLGTSGPDDIRGKSGNDTICGMGGDDFIHGNSGDDWIDGGDGIDDIRGGQGADIIFTGSGETAGNASRVFGGYGNDTIYGGADADDLRGGRGNDTIAGGDGDDEIKGNQDDDLIYGDSGNDTLSGGNGDHDILYGVDGGDTLNGGSGGNDLCNDGGDAGDAEIACEGFAG